MGKTKLLPSWRKSQICFYFCRQMLCFTWLRSVLSMDLCVGENFDFLSSRWLKSLSVPFSRSLSTVRYFYLISTLNYTWRLVTVLNRHVPFFDRQLIFFNFVRFYRFKRLCHASGPYYTSVRGHQQRLTNERKRDEPVYLSLWVKISDFFWRPGLAS